jgi:hypothetical protein
VAKLINFDLEDQGHFNSGGGGEYCTKKLNIKFSTKRISPNMKLLIKEQSGGQG